MKVYYKGTNYLFSISIKEIIWILVKDIQHPKHPRRPRAVSDLSDCGGKVVILSASDGTEGSV